MAGNKACKNRVIICLIERKIIIGINVKIIVVGDK
jgi:hypothetical protein